LSITAYNRHFTRIKTVAEIYAVQIPVNRLLDIRPPESVLPLKMLVMDLDKGFKIVLYAALII
jgi:hypothetical protein